MPRKTRFRLVANLNRTGLITRRVHNTRFQQRSLHRFPLVQAFLAHHISYFFNAHFLSFHSTSVPGQGISIGYN